jgi:hypothetical protein
MNTVTATSSGGNLASGDQSGAGTDSGLGVIIFILS